MSSSPPHHGRFSLAENLIIAQVVQDLGPHLSVADATLKIQKEFEETLNIKRTSQSLYKTVAASTYERVTRRLTQQICDQLPSSGARNRWKQMPLSSRLPDDKATEERETLEQNIVFRPHRRWTAHPYTTRDAVGMLQALRTIQPTRLFSQSHRPSRGQRMPLVTVVNPFQANRPRRLPSTSATSMDVEPQRQSEMLIDLTNDPMSDDEATESEPEPEPEPQQPRRPLVSIDITVNSQSPPPQQQQQQQQPSPPPSSSVSQPVTIQEQMRQSIRQWKNADGSRVVEEGNVEYFVLRLLQQMVFQPHIQSSSHRSDYVRFNECFLATLQRFKHVWKHHCGMKREAALAQFLFVVKNDYSGQLILLLVALAIPFELAHLQRIVKTLGGALEQVVKTHMLTLLQYATYTRNCNFMMVVLSPFHPFIWLHYRMRLVGFSGSDIAMIFKKWMEANRQITHQEDRDKWLIRFESKIDVIRVNGCP